MSIAQAQNASMPAVETAPAPVKKSGGRKKLPENERCTRLLQSVVTPAEGKAFEAFCTDKAWSESNAIREIVKDRLILEGLLPKPKRPK